MQANEDTHRSFRDGQFDPSMALFGHNYASEPTKSVLIAIETAAIEVNQKMTDATKRENVLYYLDRARISAINASTL